MTDRYLKRSIGFTLALLLLVASILYFQARNVNLPGNHQGYAPDQPIEFSHRNHAGDLEISCQYCHSGAVKSQTAGVPAGSTCMKCHKYVSASWNAVQLEREQAEQEERDPALVVSEKVATLYDYVGYNPEETRYSGASTPIPWVKIHNLPDFVVFNHSRHVTAGVDCQQCHGEVQAMERVEQTSTLAMGWCVNCHRDVNNDRVRGMEKRYASTSCGACHY